MASAGGGTVVTKEQVDKLREAISKKIKSLGVGDQVRELLADSLRERGGGALGKEEAMDVLQQKGLIDQLVLALGRPAEVTPGVGRQGTAKSFRAQMMQNRRYIMVRVCKARGFLTHLAAPPHEDERLVISGQMHGQRLRSAPVPAEAEPAFNETALIELHGPDAGNSSELHALAQEPEPLHLVVVRTGVGGAGPGSGTQVVGTAEVDWRRVLTATSGRWSCPIELHGVGAESRVLVGMVEVRLELLPQSPRALDVGHLQRVARQEASQEADALARFMARAREWWGEYVALGDAYRSRLVKVLATGEGGDQRPVCSFVRPLMAGGRLLASPREAARFVSLLGSDEEVAPAVAGAKTEVWGHLHTLLAKGSGQREEHALLLCSLLLGFGLDAFVCVGRDALGGHMWVLTRGAKGRATYWEPSTGRRFAQADVGQPGCPAYRGLGCAFDHRRLYANLQGDDSAQTTLLTFEDRALWKELEYEEVARWRLPPLVMRASSVDGPAEELRLESFLGRRLEAHRQGMGLDTEWDEHLAFKLMPALAAYEQEAAGGAASGNAEFQESIKRAVPSGWTFKGVPLHFRHRDGARILEALLREPAAVEMAATSAPQARLAMRVRVATYPEDVCSVWVMLAVKYKGLG